MNGDKKKERASKHIKTGHYQPTSETPFEWRCAGGLIVADTVC